MNNNRRIKDICFRAAFLPCFLFLSAAIISAGFLVHRHCNDLYLRELNKHDLISEIVTNAVTGDIIIGNNKAVMVALREFKSKYQLDNLILCESPLSDKQSGYLKLNFSGKVTSVIQLPRIVPAKYIIVESSTKPNEMLSPILMAASLILLFMSAAFFIYSSIKKELHHKIVKPLSSTLQHSSGNKVTFLNQDKAATEIVDLYNRINNFLKTIYSQRDKIEKSRLSEEKYKIAQQVAHDIRSPVLALETILSIDNQMSHKTKKLITNVSRRITDIANNILSAHSIEDKNQDKTNILDVINDIIDEKKAHHKNKVAFSINTENYKSDTRIYIPTSKIYRIISNLINNSIEASEHKASISIVLTTCPQKLCMEISDHGKGIPPQHLEHIFDEGFTFDKPQGHGIGLSFVKEQLSRYGSSLDIESIEKEGTKVIINMPYS